MRRANRGLVLPALLLLVAACGEEQIAEAPPPAELTRDAIGHYCNMIVQDHAGPKGQIFLSGQPEPIWFSSVRDTLAFTLLPEEPKDIAAIYVNDMGRASWDEPEAGTWIEAKGAWYVIGSTRQGGMGAPEAVPFSQRADAEGFAAAHDGRVVAFSEIPSDAILGEVPEVQHGAGHEQAGAATPDMPGPGRHHVEEAGSQAGHRHHSGEQVRE
ncbi:MAG: nitrous oxide reductase accessory protein NosL [Kiloniellales bacterium]|nr:nitrous oxide reductase accessory protein NosL [Kiloniellales bacterium]